MTKLSGLWMSLLSGCKTYKKILLGQHILDEIQMKWKHDPEIISSATILMANIYTENNQIDVANTLRETIVLPSYTYKTLLCMGPV